MSDYKTRAAGEDAQDRLNERAEMHARAQAERFGIQRATGESAAEAFASLRQKLEASSSQRRGLTHRHP